MKTRSLLLSTLILFIFSIDAIASSSNSPLLGSWEFNVNEAPWEYSRGVIIIESGEDEELTGKIEFSTGRIVEIAAISVEDDKVVFEVIVDGYDVKTDLTITEDNLRGIVQTIEGNMNFTAKRAAAE